MSNIEFRRETSHQILQTRDIAKAVTTADVRLLARDGDEYIEIDSIVPRRYLMTRLLMELGKN